jgi:hypothetical protein
MRFSAAEAMSSVLFSIKSEDLADWNKLLGSENKNKKAERVTLVGPWRCMSDGFSDPIMDHVRWKVSNSGTGGCGTTSFETLRQRHRSSPCPSSDGIALPKMVPFGIHAPIDNSLERIEQMCYCRDSKERSLISTILAKYIPTTWCASPTNMVRIVTGVPWGDSEHFVTQPSLS